MTVQEEINKISRLYKSYGFTVAKKMDFCIVFTYTNGYFYNAEIVEFKKENEYVKKIKNDYEDLGFSVRISEYSSYNRTHDFLFKGFFGIKNINERLIREYDSFKELQSKKLFESSYEYIEPTYFWNSEIKKGKLIENIFLQIENDGAQLIILEAAAGYGKTCTSYELIKIMANDERLQYAPIFTELSKNRKAAIFRYVLLDEIDKKFTSLSSQLVLQEIRNGMVPLIIDGFDELISRSSPNMSNSILQEDDSQTMLDTIAELFDEGCKTKVVLTSRKSAIFTGDIFNEWIKYKLPNCNVTRISIEEPTIQDWLGYEKLQFLKTQRIPFTNIVNPILLAFMRSMSIEKFMEKCSNVEKVIDYYFESLLNREIERQAL